MLENIRILPVVVMESRDCVGGYCWTVCSSIGQMTTMFLLPAIQCSVSLPNIHLVTILAGYAVDDTCLVKRRLCRFNQSQQWPDGCLGPKCYPNIHPAKDTSDLLTGSFDVRKDHHCDIYFLFWSGFRLNRGHCAVNEASCVAIVLENFTNMFPFLGKCFFAVADTFRTLQESAYNSCLHMRMVVGIKMKIHVSVCWFPENLCVEGTVRHIPHHQNIQKRKSPFLFHFHRELDGWSYWVKVVEEIVKVVSIVGPQNESVVDISQPYVRLRVG